MDILNCIDDEILLVEKVLWSEMTDISMRNTWLKQQFKSDKFWAPIAFAFGIFLCYVFMSSILEGSLDPNKLFALLEIIVMIFLISSLFFMFWHSAKAYFGKSVHRNSRPISGYVLTDKRLLIFGLEYQLLETVIADNIKSAKIYKRMKWNFSWYPLCIILSAVGTRTFKFAELYFLADFDQSCIQINNAIKEPPND